MGNKLRGSFIPNTLIWDVQDLQKTDVNSPEFKELLVRLYQYINNMSIILNNKDTGMYDVNEFITGQKYFADPTLNSSTKQKPTLRGVMRKTIYYPHALPNTGTVTIPHGINCTKITRFVCTYGEANDPAGLNYIPLPFASPTLAQNVSVSVNATNVTIVTGSNRSNFTDNFIILEYLQ